MNIIAKHLEKYIGNLKPKIYEGLDTICSFSGEKITRGVKNDDLIKETFTDHEYIKYNSGYTSIDYALLLSEILPSPSLKGNLVALRVCNYFVTEQDIVFPSRGDILDIILNLKQEQLPFILVVTYSNKKHTAYKTRLNYDTKKFMVRTDVSDVWLDMDVVEQYLPIIQSWYTIVKGKEDTTQQPTYFSKEEILTGKIDYNKSVQYGFEKANKENQFLQKFRGKTSFKLIVHLINKKIYED